MSRKAIGPLVALIVVCSLAGGILGSWLMQPRHAGAQQTQYTASNFRLVDSAGNVRGVFQVADNGRAALVLADQNGRPRAAVGVAPSGDPEVVLFDENGNELYRAP